MIIFWLLLGLIPPTASGWCLLLVLEGRTPVLTRLERIALGCLTGLTGTMFLTFCATAFAGIPLTLAGYAGVQALTLVVTAGLAWWKKRIWLPASPPLASSHAPAFWVRWAVAVLLGYTLIKLVFIGTVFLFLTPTYLDDSLDNWNLRAKVFWHDHALTLVLPNEDPITSPKGVSSYPPTVPLAKAWLATLHGNWSDALINSIHIVWLAIALTLLYCLLRRKVSVWWALFGVYVLGSMPLYDMHGTNAYADAFLSAHVLSAAGFLFVALTGPRSHRAALLRVAGFCTALVPFVKNEGLLLYVPPLLLILVIAIAVQMRRKTISTKEIIHDILAFAIPLIIVLGPWLFFKWSHGLTFGNGKPFTSLGFGWQQGVITAIVVNTFFEGNWLLLFPILFTLIVWRWKAALGPYLILTAFFLMLYVGQIVLYLFTGLSTEAVMQTGYARGLVQLLPSIVLLTVFLVHDALPSLWPTKTIAESHHLQTHSTTQHG